MTRRPQSNKVRLSLIDWLGLIAMCVTVTGTLVGGGIKLGSMIWVMSNKLATIETRQENQRDEISQVKTEIANLSHRIEARE